MAAITRHNVLFLFAYALAFIGGYLLVRRLSTDSGSPRAGSEPVSEGEEESGNEEEASEDMDEEPEEEDDSEEDGNPDDESEAAEPDTEKTAG